MHALRLSRLYITPFLPYFIAAAGFYPAAGLRSPITAWPTAEPLYFFGLLAVSVVWLIFEIKFVFSHETEIGHLAFDCFLQTVVALTFATIGGYYYAGGTLFEVKTLQWWFIVPGSVAIFDAVISNLYIVHSARNIVREEQLLRSVERIERLIEDRWHVPADGSRHPSKQMQH